RPQRTGLVIRRIEIAVDRRDQFPDFFREVDLEAVTRRRHQLAAFPLISTGPVSKSKNRPAPGVTPNSENGSPSSVAPLTASAPGTVRMVLNNTLRNNGRPIPTRSGVRSPVPRFISTSRTAPTTAASRYR